MRTATSREAIGAEVRAGLARKGLTQKQLAAVLGVTETTLSGRIRGRTPFDTDELALISDLIGVPIAELLPASPQPSSAA